MRSVANVFVVGFVFAVCPLVGTESFLGLLTGSSVLDGGAAFVCCADKCVDIVSEGRHHGVGHPRSASSTVRDVQGWRPSVGSSASLPAFSLHRREQGEGRWQAWLAIGVVCGLSASLCRLRLKSTRRPGRLGLRADTKTTMKERNKMLRRNDNSMRLRQLREEAKRKDEEIQRERENMEFLEREEARQETNARAADWAERQEKLVDMEWIAENNQISKRLNDWSVERLVSQGLVLVNLRAKTVGTYFGDAQIKFSTARGGPLPPHEFQRGDAICLSNLNETKTPAADDDEDENEPEATAPRAQVLGVAGDSIICVVKGWLDESQLWRLDRGANNVMYDRTMEAIRVFGRDVYIAEAARNVLMGVKVEESNAVEDSFHLDTSAFTLNEPQEKAIRSMASNRVTLIQGPPGCGKTYTACALLASARSGTGKPMLATADSHIAVDQLAAGLIALGVKVVRLGAAANVTDDAAQKASVHVQMEQHARYNELQDLRSEVIEQAASVPRLRAQIDAQKRNIRKGINIEAIADKASVEVAGVPSALKKIKPDPDDEGEETSEGEKEPEEEPLDVQLMRANDALPEKRRKAQQKETELERDIIKNAEVVCTTLAGCGSKTLQNMYFDVIVLDEATQATEPRATLGVNKLSADGRLVLVGDQKQLPPVCLSQEADASGLGVSLFERLLRHPLLTPTMLQVQFRMHPLISAWPSATFYDGRLIDGVSAEEREPVSCFGWPSAGGVAFIASTGLEGRSGDGNSWVNDVECGIVQKVVQQLRRCVPANDIGVISPYKGQVQRLSSLLRKAVEVRTVDGYQGREKSVIVLSAVRSNDTGTIGFLADSRRLNVAITRAQRGLVVIGNPDTLRHDKHWRSWLDFVKKNELEVVLQGNGTFVPEKQKRGSTFEFIQPPLETKRPAEVAESTEEDYSHLLFTTDSLIWCWRCGHYGPSREHVERFKCGGRPGPGKKIRLERLKKGRHPISNDELEGQYKKLDA